MERKFNLIEMQKRGAGTQVAAAIGVVVLLILVSALAPTALIGLFNTTAFSGVPAWVPTALGSLGAIAFIYIIWKSASK
jgi:hypothetical protein